MNLPSLDQAVGYGNPSFARISPPNESSRRLRRSVGGAMPCETKAISVPSGDQTGEDSDPGSAVKRLNTSRERSAIQRSDSPVAESIFSTTAFRPSGERQTLE